MLWIREHWSEMLRPFQEKDAAVCFEIIVEAAATMSGLNEAARAYVAEENDAGTIRPGRYRAGEAVFQYVVMRKSL